MLSLLAPRPVVLVLVLVLVPVLALALALALALGLGPGAARVVVANGRVTAMPTVLPTRAMANRRVVDFSCCMNGTFEESREPGCP